MRSLALLSLLAGACYNPDFGSTGTMGLFCHPDDSPACPDGSACMQQGNDYRCVTTTTGTSSNNNNIPTIPKTTTSTPTSNAMLDTTADCPDTALEPNDNLSQARQFSITPDSASTPKLVRLAICPKGSGDVDVFAIPVPSSGLTMMAELFYEVSYGDLDVAILDNNGNMVSYDGSSTSNACTTASVSAGTYYVAIQGANGQVNRYDARIRLFSSPHPCGAQ
jgi:hypothetical protein